MGIQLIVQLIIVLSVVKNTMIDSHVGVYIESPSIMFIIRRGERLLINRHLLSRSRYQL